MIKCFFVDVKSIKSDLPKSNFVESELEQLADLLLAVDGLLRPLILKETKAGKYTVIAGHREYYAAVRAKEKNLAKAEMVNAFVIDANTRKSAIAQLALLAGESSSNLINATDEQLSLAQVLPIIESHISQQIQPILERLTKHEEILDTLTSPAPVLPIIESTIADRLQPILAQLDRHNALLDTLQSAQQEAEISPVNSINNKAAKAADTSPLTIPSGEDLPKPVAINEVTPQKTTKSATTSKKKATAIEIPSSPIVSGDDLPKPPQPKAAAVAKTTKSTPKSKVGSNFLESIDPTKAANTLNLINTLSQQQLMVIMEKSGLKTIVKLVPTIIEYRDKLPDRQIDRWETIIDAKISGLTEAAIKKIIDKLK
jgi:ParB-like chromosome segregation protein Spo0J